MIDLTEKNLCLDMRSHAVCPPHTYPEQGVLYPEKIVLCVGEFLVGAGGGFLPGRTGVTSGIVCGCIGGKEVPGA